MAKDIHTHTHTSTHKMSHLRIECIRILWNWIKNHLVKGFVGSFLFFCCCSRSQIPKTIPFISRVFNYIITLNKPMNWFQWLESDLFFLCFMIFATKFFIFPVISLKFRFEIGWRTNSIKKKKNGEI